MQPSCVLSAERGVRQMLNEPSCDRTCGASQTSASQFGGVEAVEASMPTKILI
jgi:hypothetical protein